MVKAENYVSIESLQHFRMENAKELLKRVPMGLAALFRKNLFEWQSKLFF